MTQQQPATQQHHILVRYAFPVVGLMCLIPIVGPPVGLAVGAAFALVFGNPYEAQCKKWNKPLLQTCVVLLGFKMNFHELVKVGASGWIFSILSITFTLALGWWLGRLLRLEPKPAILISSGTAICGGSAIAAVGPVIAAAEADMTVALGTVFMLNAVALYVFPILGHVLQLSQEQFGMWAGIAIHDISSVVGAASVYGAEALQVATAVKLSRTLWIVPMALAISYAWRRWGSEETTATARTAVPWFIALFVLASVVRSTVPAIEPLLPAIGAVSHQGLTLTLFMVGAGLTRKVLRSAGWRALVLGFVLWLFISGLSLGLVVCAGSKL